MQHKTFSTFSFLFALLFIITVPFPHQYMPNIGSYLQPLSESLVKFTGKYIFNIHHSYTSQLISDSTGLYLHVFNLFIISLLCSFITVFKPIKNYDKFLYWSTVIITYYLALQLFEYGFSKLFKWQFYLPEPNTLFTTIGNTYPDLMYWSTMGLSRSYTIFTGITELVAATLLLFRRTRPTGGVIGFFVLVNVVAINFCYDISVKILSVFLLILSMIIISSGAKKWFAFLFRINLAVNQPDILFIKNKRWYIILKIFVVAYMLLSTLAPYISENNYNDDNAARPLFHGAYSVPVFIRNKDSLPLLLNTLRWKRAFVHRKGYFITQDMYDEMQDYALITDTIHHTFTLTNTTSQQSFKLNYTAMPDGIIKLNGIINNDTLSVLLQTIDLKGLPVLQQEFHWTSDGL